jgi:hypothetical protein
MGCGVFAADSVESMSPFRNRRSSFSLLAETCIGKNDWIMSKADLE